jgi:uncharacterized protein (DUF1800 family)
MTTRQSAEAIWTTDDVRHLLGRISFAVDETQVARLHGLSCYEAIELLLNEAQQAAPPGPPEWVQSPWINTERRHADTTPDEFRKMHGMTNGRYLRETADLRRWWLNEMFATTVPLREIMTLFWHGHFASSIGKVLVPQAMYQQNATQRRFALGNFREFLREMTLDPAMLIYLDLEDSDRAQPNENYARELYELFALGHGNYSQQDIMETARALSGWRLGAEPETELPNRATNPETNRRFTRDGLIPQLEAARHDGGDKTLFGMSGNHGLEEVVTFTVNHPACGQFLAGKLLRFFAVADPQGEVRERMAAEFRATHGEIAPMVRVMLNSNEFYSGESRARLIKSPIALLVGAARQLGLEVTPTSGINRYLAALGQELFNPPNVKGWPGEEAWISTGTLALRYHLADIVLDSKEPPGMDPIGRGRGRPVPLPKDPAERQAMLQNMMNGGPRGEGSGENDAPAEGARRRGPDSPAIQVKFSAQQVFPAGAPEATEQLVDQLLARLFSHPPRDELRLAAYETARRTTGDDRVRAVMRLVLSSPDYQLA